MNGFIKRLYTVLCLLVVVFTFVACTKTQYFTVEVYDGETLLDTKTVEEGSLTVY